MIGIDQIELGAADEVVDPTDVTIQALLNANEKTVVALQHLSATTQDGGAYDLETAERLVEAAAAEHRKALEDLEFGLELLREMNGQDDDQ